MSNLQTISQDDIAVQPDQQYSPQQITLDDNLFNKCHRLAQMMASGRCTVPKHLQGNEGDCFAIIGQSLRWGMDPYAVAQKTHLVNGTLGYEAQLVIAVINARAPITDRISFDYFGDWSKVKSKDDKSDDVGVIVRATFKGYDEPTKLSLTMSQVGTVRNSPLWTADPRQQLAYLAAKRWARLNCPDVILGVYTPDELDACGETVKDVTPKKSKNAGASALLNRIKTEPEPEVVYFDTSELLSAIEQISSHKQADAIGRQIKVMRDDASINIKDDDLVLLRKAFADKKNELTYNNLMSEVKQASYENASMLEGVINDKRSEIGDQKADHLIAVLNEVAN